MADEVEIARAKARAELPCQRCGSESEPLIRKPRPLSADWWIEPRAYIGCADCGQFLASMPRTYPVSYGSQVADDQAVDPAGFMAQVAAQVARAIERLERSGDAIEKEPLAAAIPGRERGAAYARRIGVPGWEPEAEPVDYVGLTPALRPYFVAQVCVSPSAGFEACQRDIAKLAWLRTVDGIEAAFLFFVSPLNQPGAVIPERAPSRLGPGDGAAQIGSRCRNDRRRSAMGGPRDRGHSATARSGELGAGAGVEVAMDPVDETVTVAGPLYGVRLWDVLFDRGMYVLASEWNPWQSDGRPSAAICRVGEDDGFEPEHPAPWPQCSCGFSASHPNRSSLGYVLQDSLEEIGNPNGHPGVVEAWGRVELDREGIRAQFARPHSFFLTRNLDGTDWAEEQRRVAANHRAEVLFVDDERDALELLARRGLGWGGPELDAQLGRREWASLVVKRGGAR